MIKRFIWLLYLIPSLSIACSCATQYLIDNVANATFVAQVKILETIEESKNTDFFIVKIEVLELYKGSATNTIKIFTDGSMCYLDPQPETKWLVFTSEDENGNTSVQYCSGSQQIDQYIDSDHYPKAQSNYENSVKTKLSVLKALKAINVKPDNSHNLRVRFKGNCFKNNVDYSDDKRNYALFKIVINESLTVEKAIVLKSFEDKLIQTTEACVRDNLVVYNHKKITQIPDKTELIIALYYYPAEKENTSFLSFINL